MLAVVRIFEGLQAVAVGALLDFEAGVDEQLEQLLHVTGVVTLEINHDPLLHDLMLPIRLLLVRWRLRRGRVHKPDSDRIGGRLGSPDHVAGDCPVSGVTGSGGHQLVVVGVSRPSKAMSKALRAAFHRITHRALPRPVGSRDRVTR